MTECLVTVSSHSLMYHVKNISEEPDYASSTAGNSSNERYKNQCLTCTRYSIIIFPIRPVSPTGDTITHMSATYGGASAKYSVACDQNLPALHRSKYWTRWLNVDPNPFERIKYFTRNAGSGTNNCTTT